MSSSQSSLPISDDRLHPGPAPLAGAPLGTFLARLSGSLRRLLARCRPWVELVDRSAVSMPSSYSEAATRIRKNAYYFRVNYIVISASVTVLLLLFYPLPLLTLLVLLAAWIFLYLLRSSDQPLVILNRTFSNVEILTALVALTVIVIFLTSIGSLLISAILMGVWVVCVHGAFRDPDDLFLDDNEVPGSGMFSMFSGAASAAAAVAPGMMSQV